MEMILNYTKEIENDKGDFVVLCKNDYGLAVIHQADSARDALDWALGCGYCASYAIVKIVRIKTEEISS